MRAHLPRRHPLTWRDQSCSSLHTVKATRARTFLPAVFFCEIDTTRPPPLYIKYLQWTEQKPWRLFLTQQVLLVSGSGRVQPASNWPASAPSGAESALKVLQQLREPGVCASRTIAPPSLCGRHGRRRPRRSGQHPVLWPCVDVGRHRRTLTLPRHRPQHIRLRSSSSSTV